MRGLFPILLFATAVQVLTPALPLRIGPTGASFTADDVEQVGKICSAEGKAAWVLFGQAPGKWVGQDRWYAIAYLSPDRATANIRRGRTREVFATLPARAVYTEPRKWQSGNSGEWAQVPVPGTNPDEVRSSRDLNRPFQTFGSLDDDALVAIVSLIRSGPIIPVPSWASPARPAPRESTNVEATWPIGAVVTNDPLSGGQVVVRLLSPQVDERYGQVVTLRQADNKWVILSLGTFIFD